MKKRPLLLTASILSADLASLQHEVESIASAVDAIQIDVMDGHFVPNLSFGASVAASITTNLSLDVHLMVTNPADRLAEFLAIPVQHITFHAEAVPATSDRRALIAAIRAGGATAGIAINPQTPTNTIDDVVDDVDLVLLMSVEPGFGGQAFIASTLEKIQELRAAHPGCMIQVDGGINADTAQQCIAAGADNLVIGSALFRAQNRKEFLESLRDGAA
jgi:ribulose-phosphate 3-epimerase